MPISIPAFTTTASISGNTLIANTDNQLNLFMSDAKMYVETTYNTVATSLEGNVGIHVTTAKAHSDAALASSNIATQSKNDAASSASQAASSASQANSSSLSATASVQIATDKAYAASQSAIAANQSATDAATNAAAVANHLANKSNPHTVTKAQVGLGNVTNTSDTNKPVIGFDIANITPPTKGQLAWNQDEQTLDLGLGSVTLQIGQETQVPVVNNTANTIPNGRVVMSTGTLGNSGHITIALANVAQGKAMRLVGITTTDIPAGAQGVVTVFGKVRAINTTGAAYGETWVDGDILYVKPNNAGALTKVVPTDTEIKVPIATVIKAHTNGSIFVRLTPIDENHYKADLATKAKVTQLVALAQALGLSQAQINAILAL